MIAIYLMLGTYSLHLQDLSQFIQTSMQVITELHEVLDVIDGGEVDLQDAPGLDMMITLHVRCTAQVEQDLLAILSLTFSSSKNSASVLGKG